MHQSTCSSHTKEYDDFITLLSSVRSFPISKIIFTLQSATRNWEIAELAYQGRVDLKTQGNTVCEEVFHHVRPNHTTPK